MTLRCAVPAPLPPCDRLQELQVALRGKAMDPNAGSWDLDPVFNDTKFKFGYLVSDGSVPGVQRFWLGACSRGRRTP